MTSSTLVHKYPRTGYSAREVLLSPTYSSWVKELKTWLFPIIRLIQQTRTSTARVYSFKIGGLCTALSNTQQGPSDVEITPLVYSCCHWILQELPHKAGVCSTSQRPGKAGIEVSGRQEQHILPYTPNHSGFPAELARRKRHLCRHSAPRQTHQLTPGEGSFLPCPRRIWWWLVLSK